MPRLTERTRDARRRQILDAARRRFARNGFHATSMHDIFTEAGLSAGAVYSHFSGKDEIVAAIADEVIDAVTEALAPATAGDPPSLDDLFEHLFTTLQRANVATIAITVWAEAVRDPALGRRLSTRYRRMRHQLTELVAAGYNSNAAKIPGYIRRAGAGWRSLIPRETQLYLQIYQSLDVLMRTKENHARKR